MGMQLELDDEIYFYTRYNKYGEDMNMTRYSGNIIKMDWNHIVVENEIRQYLLTYNDKLSQWVEQDYYYC